MTVETVTLGCPDCGLPWPDVPGPLADLDGRKFECVRCGRGFVAHVSVSLVLSRH